MRYDKNLFLVESKGENYHWVRKIRRAIGTHYPRKISPRPNSLLCNRGKLQEEEPSAAPVTGNTYRSRDFLVNARSDYRGELIATDREMHWRRCGAQPSVVAFLLRWFRRWKSMSGDDSTCTPLDVSIIEHPIILLRKNLFRAERKFSSLSFSCISTSFFCFENIFILGKNTEAGTIISSSK